MRFRMMKFLMGAVAVALVVVVALFWLAWRFVPR
jgi:hypothetical protein